MTTVDRSDIRGLVTARLGFVAELLSLQFGSSTLGSYPIGLPRILLTGVALPETVLDKGSCSYRLSPTGFMGCGRVSADSLHFNGALNFVGDRPHKRTKLSGHGRYNQLVGFAFGDKAFVTGT